MRIAVALIPLSLCPSTFSFAVIDGPIDDPVSSPINGSGKNPVDRLVVSHVDSFAGNSINNHVYTSAASPVGVFADAPICLSAFDITLHSLPEEQ